MFDWFTIILALMVLSIVLVIVNAVKRTKTEIDERFKRSTPTERERDMRKLADEICSRDVRCSRCGEQAIALLGTGNKYKCETCNHEFDGPEHISSKAER
jgi:DNA-directed RNA polymerase subunit RPC12/RpoP